MSTSTLSTQPLSTIDDHAISHPPINSIASRILGMTYAVVAYAIGAGALFWVFFAAGGFAPYGFFGNTQGVVPALAINLALVFLFAVQHTIMARTWFKQWLTRWIPAALERATFVLLSGIAMATLVSCWQDVPGTAWQIQNSLGVYALYALYAVGILYTLTCSLVTNHFELFGLRQAWFFLIGKAYTPLKFKQVWMYRYSRHPMMLGILLVLWASPDMSVTRLVLAVLLTVYIFTGIRFEERSLMQEFGDQYRQYQKQIGLFFTLPGRKG